MQRCRNIVALGLPLLFATAPLALAQDAPPTEAEARIQVDNLIDQAPQHRITLGRIEGAMAASISFGAAAWNQGDHAACCRFYVKTGQSLCDAFAGDAAATAPARQVLNDLKSALDRVSKSTDIDANAWTMRFVFDLADIANADEAERSVRLVALGRQCLARSEFHDAATAFSQAATALHELEGQPLERLPVPCRFAPLALGDALFGERRFNEAAAAVEDGLISLPQWPTTAIDIRESFGNHALYELLLDDLRAAVAAHPDDAELQFLLGYQLYFTGRRDEAKSYFQTALKLNPNHSAAKTFLNASSAPLKTTPATPPPATPSRNGDL